MAPSDRNQTKLHQSIAFTGYEFGVWGRVSLALLNKIGPTPQCRESATRSERCKASSSASSMSSAAHRAFLDGFRVGMGNDAGESFVTQLFVGKSPLVVPLIRQDLHILCDELSNKDTEGADGSTFEGKAASSQRE